MGAVLLTLSAAYRLFGEKKPDSQKPSFPGTEEAKADTYSQGEYGCSGCDTGCASQGNCDGGTACFKGDILVLIKKTEKGTVYKKFEDLQAGDDIVGAEFDKDGNPALVPSKILKVLHHEPEPYEFSLLTASNGVQIVATNNHPFITSGENNFTTLEELRSGQKIVTILDRPVWSVVSHKVSLPMESAPLFHLKTTTQNYLVSMTGNGAVLAHNGSGGK